HAGVVWEAEARCLADLVGKAFGAALLLPLRQEGAGAHGELGAVAMAGGSLLVRLIPHMGPATKVTYCPKRSPHSQQRFSRTAVASFPWPMTRKSYSSPTLAQNQGRGNPRVTGRVSMRSGISGKPSRYRGGFIALPRLAHRTSRSPPRRHPRPR